jgi:hypothetical protein
LRQRSELGVLDAGRVGDAYRQRLAAQQNLGHDHACLAAVLGRVADRVAVHAKQELRINVDERHLRGLGVELEARREAEVVAQQLIDRRHRGLGRVVRVCELLGHGSGECRVERALELGREVAQPVLERRVLELGRVGGGGYGGHGDRRRRDRAASALG